MLPSYNTKDPHRSNEFRYMQIKWIIIHNFLVKEL